MRNKIFAITILIILVSGLCLLFAKSKITKSTDNKCYDCHISLDGKNLAPAKAFSKDVHFTKGITCADCHGGDPTSDDMDVAMSKEKGFIGVPKSQERYKTCAKCHADEKVMKRFNSNLPTDQLEELESSVHSKTSSDSKGYIADCITCHSVHDIASVKSPLSKVYPTNIPSLCGSCHSNANYMKQYNPKLPVDQVSKYYTSMHGQLNQKGDITVAQCVSCHGNHGIRDVKDPKASVYPLNIPKVCSNCHSNETKMAKYKIPTNQFSLFEKSVHGIALFKKQDLNAPTCNSCHGNHGATPPGVESISNVCGTCHNLNADLFEKSPHKVAFDNKNIPECEICHGNHGIQPAGDNMIGVKGNAVCIKCHKNNPQDKGYFVALKMKKMIDSLKSEQSNAQTLLNDANSLGMDVSDAIFAFKDIKQALIETRTIIHVADYKKFDEDIQSGFNITSKAKTAGQAAISDYYFRRKGLGIATILVTILAIGLYLLIKRIDRKGKKVERA